MSRFTTSALVVALAFAVPSPDLAAQSSRGRPNVPPALDSARAALERFKDPMVAVAEGYLSTVACIHFPAAGKAGETPFPAGGMGVHLLNAALIGQPLDPARPQVLIYAPHGDSLRLAAAEWFVPTQVSKERPQMFGRGLDGPMAGHQPIMPESLEHWDLHVWLWQDNPAGVFTPTNPALTCPAGAMTIHAHN